MPKQTSGAEIDIVIPVHNALESLYPLLDSIAAQEQAFISNTIIVDDGSDRKTSAALANLGSSNESVRILKNVLRQGFTKSANKGLQSTSSPLVFLLNSDIVLGPHSLFKMSQALLETSSFGIVGPLSNAGGFQSIPRFRKTFFEKVIRSTPKNPMPSWEEIVQTDAVLGKRFRKQVAEVPFLNGFCLGIKQDVIERCGLLDEEAFPDGYGEEIDYCLRVKASGWTTALVPGAYVAHSKSQSYGFARRTILTTRGINKLKDIHGKESIQNLFLEAETFPSRFWQSVSE